VLAVTGDLIDTGMPARFVTVYHPLLLVLLGLAGPVIGVLGALLPAARAGRMPTAPVLRSE
jgi:putative ABC transport system permease protein